MYVLPHCRTPAPHDHSHRPSAMPQRLGPSQYRRLWERLAFGAPLPSKTTQKLLSSPSAGGLKANISKGFSSPECFIHFFTDTGVSSLQPISMPRELRRLVKTQFGTGQTHLKHRH